MKLIIQILISIFIFTGCTTLPEPQKVQAPITSSYKVEKKIKKEETQKLTKIVVPVEVPVKTNEIAIVFPSSTIGQYALEATNSINTYLLYKNKPFKLSVMDIITTTKENILKVFDDIKSKNITKVIVMLTTNELYLLKEIEDIGNIQIYLPLINKYELDNINTFENLNILYGAISYKEQFKTLLTYVNGEALAELYDNSIMGNILHSYLTNENTVYSKKVDDNNGRYKSFLTDNEKIENTVIVLNTPIIKSSILLSAFTAEELNVSKVISTQLNYTPLLFSLTQKIDREKLIVANSIGEIPSELNEHNNLISNNMSYSWVNYAVIVGAEYLISDNIELFKDLSIEENQVIYPVKLYKVSGNSFDLIK